MSGLRWSRNVVVVAVIGVVDALHRGRPELAGAEMGVVFGYGRHKGRLKSQKGTEASGDRQVGRRVNSRAQTACTTNWHEVNSHFGGMIFHKRRP